MSIRQIAVDGHEVFDVMPNGQLRFAVYDASGHLAPAAPVSRSRAGKPSKCLWCHESKALPLFASSPDVKVLLTSPEFHQLIDSANTLLTQYRNLLFSDVNYEDRQAHTQSKLLYINFMESSANTIAREWGWEESKVRLLLQGFPSHEHGEFPQLGKLYYRRWVDSLVPFSTLEVPRSIREPSENEPNYFR